MKLRELSKECEILQEELSYVKHDDTWRILLFHSDTQDGLLDEVKRYLIENHGHQVKSDWLYLWSHDSFRKIGILFSFVNELSVELFDYRLEHLSLLKQALIEEAGQDTHPYHAALWFMD